MDLDALSGSPVGQLVPITGRDARHGPYAYFAFLPSPLPEDVWLSSATWAVVSEASTALGKLDQACRQLPDPRLLIRPALWRESLDTLALEGTFGALPDLLEAQLPSSHVTSPEVAEIRAYERVAMRAFDLIGDRPISGNFLCQLQSDLFEGTQKQPSDLGRLRQYQVWIGPKDRPIGEARFVPVPEGDRLRAGLDAWEKWVQAEHPHLPPVLRCALAHYQLETLHPFSDGNGRIGRLVIVLQLLRSGTLQQPAVTVSPWFLKNRSEYQSHLFNLSCTGDWNPWVVFFCRAVSEQCLALLSAPESLLAWLSDSRRLLHERRWTGAIHKLLEDLIEWPVITIPFAATRYKVTTMNATRMVNHLVEVGVLKELTGKSYGRTFGATEVMRIIERLR